MSMDQQNLSGGPLQLMTVYGIRWLQLTQMGQQKFFIDGVLRSTTSVTTHLK